MDPDELIQLVRELSQSQRNPMSPSQLAQAVRKAPEAGRGFLAALGELDDVPYHFKTGLAGKINLSGGRPLPRNDLEAVGRGVDRLGGMRIPTRDASPLVSMRDTMPLRDQTWSLTGLALRLARAANALPVMLAGAAVRSGVGLPRYNSKDLVL